MSFFLDFIAFNVLEFMASTLHPVTEGIQLSDYMTCMHIDLCASHPLILRSFKLRSSLLTRMVTVSNTCLYVSFHIGITSTFLVLTFSDEVLFVGAMHGRFND